MNKKRIAVVVPGGVGSGFYNQGLPALMNLISGLAERFDVTVYSMVSISDTFSPDGFAVRFLQADHRQWTPWRMLKLSVMILKDHKKRPYELFHGIWGGASGMLAVLLGKWLDRPSVVSLRGGETADVQTIGYGHLHKRTKRKRLFRSLYTANQVTALTRFQVEALRKYGFEKEVVVVPTGVDTSLFVPVEKEFRAPFHFLHIANLTEVKDQETLLRTFRLIRDEVDCKLIIIGADYLHGKLQRLCHELQLEHEVLFLGPVRNTELPHHFAKAHILLHTSLYESQAVVVAEAAACKVLVCGTKTGLIADLGQQTIAVEPGDHAGLANKVLSILEDKERYESIVESAYTWAKAHSIEYTVDQFTTIYNSLT
ncbi:hexosyltransferase [Fulvivirga imtechensis AK7]|uniref:Hexosyltransferase n=1 Tax=Fulvivirga imtechensis AK7 TaxID=1237149 RepID=L8JMJ2_9BACT|nr:glycosyltransferase family 4 protein [Fulvivirga imtechensis]ELR70136.1 hexosyltransferase [Fulvivirga imtechensis AK7]